jgi:hypothetical protein
MSLSKRVADEIRAEVARQHKTSAWLARELPFDPSGLRRRLQTGKKLDLDLTEQIAVVLNVPVERFFQGRAA